MSQNPGNRKANKRKKRPTGKSGANKQQSQQKPQATQAASSSESTSGQSQEKPQSKRTGRKEAAQAQAKKTKQLQMIIGGVAAAVVIAVIFILVNRPTSSGIDIDYSDITMAQSDVVQNIGTPSAPLDPTTLNFSTGAEVGDPNAPVTMHVFSDFQCHFCKSFHDDTLPQVMDEFVRTGQVKLVYHDFPRLGTDTSIADANDVSIEINDPDNESAQAAHAAMCAGEQGEYMEMGDRIFGNFSGVQQGAYSRANLNRFAEDQGLEMDAFNECMDSGRYLPAIAKSVEQGQANGITATPMFILDNGNGDVNVIQQTAEGYSLMKKQIELSIETAP